MTAPENRPDNRNAQRVMTVFKAARIASAQADDLGLIRNISTEGVMVETQLMLLVDDAVLIEIQSGSYLAEDDVVRLDDVYGRHNGEECE